MVSVMLVKADRQFHFAMQGGISICGQAHMRAVGGVRGDTQGLKELFTDETIS